MNPKIHVNLEQRLRATMTAGCSSSSPVLAEDRARLILAALDGIKFWRILHLLEPSGTDLAKVRYRLEQLIDSEDSL